MDEFTLSDDRENVILTLTPRERKLFEDLVGNALDQAHDARQQGEDSYLDYLEDGDTVEDVEVSLLSAWEKLTGKAW